MTFLLFVIPVFVWLFSYIYLCSYYKKINITKIKIHESGRYNLVETIFYFNHFLRELLIDTILAACIYLTYKTLIPNVLASWKYYLSGYSVFVASFFIVFLVIIFIGSVRKVGAKNTLLDFFQYRELDTVVKVGSHWKMHFLSTLFIMLMLVIPATLSKSIDIVPFFLVFSLFLFLSLVFGVNKKSVTDKRWLMHGGREILTFFFLGFLPFYLPVIFLLPAIHLEISFLTILVCCILVFTITYIAAIFLTSDVKGLAQGNFGFIYLIASHFFEHTLDFFYMLLLVFVLISLRL